MDGLVDTSLARFGIAVTAAFISACLALWALVRTFRADRQVEKMAERVDAHEEGDNTYHDQIQERIVPDLRADLVKLEGVVDEEKRYTRKERSDIWTKLDDCGQRLSKIEGRLNGGA